MFGILKKCGFDSRLSIVNINENSIVEIENFINENPSTLNDANLPEPYYKMDSFKLLPGHKSLLLNLPKYIESNEAIIYPQLLQLLLNSTKLNSGKDSRQNRYDEIIRYFSIYVFLMSGRMFYEMLSSNLPIPHVTTIRKYIHLLKRKLSN